MPNKSLDGIKKLSGEELAKARKIVLDSIGETDKREKKKEEKNFSSPGRKMLDGISSSPVRLASRKIIIAKNEALKEKESPGKDLGAEYQKKEKEAPVILPSSRSVAFKRSLSSGIAQIGKAARGEAKFKKQSPPRRDRKSKGAKKIRIEEERRRKEAEIQKKKEEKARAKEAEAKIRVEKEKEKIRIKEQEEKIRQERKRQKRQARKIWFLETKRRLSGLLGGFGKSFRLAGKIMAFSALFLIVSAVLFYLVFALLLLKFNLDNKISRQIASYAPVPAVITKIGFIEYYNYQNIMGELEKELNNRQEMEQAARAVFIEKISLVKLARKYNISLSGREQEEVEKEINMRLAINKEANKVSYSRINKIKELISQPQTGGEAGESFEKIGEKYGDEQGYVNGDNEFLQLAEEVRQLESGQISDIIITDRGYYIVNKEDGRLKYIFVKSLTFSQYFEEMISGLKVWVLTK